MASPLARPWPPPRLAARAAALLLGLLLAVGPAAGDPAAGGPAAGVTVADITVASGSVAGNPGGGHPMTGGPAADAGGQARLEPPPARRAISLAPHATELIFAAGAGGHLLATVESSDHPEAARALPRVGDGVTVNPELLLAWRPDLVAAWQPTSALVALAPALARLGIPLVYSRPRSLDDIATEILRYGRLFGTEATARQYASAWRSRLAALRERHRNRPLLTVFIELGGEPLYTLGPDPLLRDVLAACGAANLYEDSPTPALTVAMEDVLVRRPDALLLPGRRPAQARARLAVWQRHALPAAVAGRFHAYDPDLLHRPGPRLLDAAEALCADLDRIRNTGAAAPASAPPRP